MNYIYFAWIASFVFGLEVIIGKLTSKHTVTNPWLFNFIWSLFIIILILPFALANHVGLPQITPNLLYVSFWYAAANIFYIISLQLLDVTVIGPLINFRSVFSVILGVIMLGEKITTYQIVLIGIIFIAGILVNLDEKLSIKSFFKPAIAIVMLFMFSLASYGIYTNIVIAESGYWATTLWTMILAQILFLGTLPLFWKDLKKTNISKYSGLFYMSLASAGGTLAANLAYTSNVGITSTILSLPFSTILTIIISKINPNLLEHHTAKIYTLRIIFTAIMIIVALQLSP